MVPCSQGAQGRPRVPGGYELGFGVRLLCCLQAPWPWTRASASFFIKWDSNNTLQRWPEDTGDNAYQVFSENNAWSVVSTHLLAMVTLFVVIVMSYSFFPLHLQESQRHY